MRPVDDGMVVCHVDGAGRAGTLAGTAGNAAVVAHESGVGALLGVGAARRNGELALDELDDALLAGARAQPHPMQADVSTTATPRSLMWMAFLRHTPTHVPQPMQPCLQPCRSQPPLHMTTATGWGFLGRVAAGLAVLCLLLS